MGRIIEIADGRNIAFAGTEESITEYQSRFFANLREGAHAGDPDIPPVRVWYGKKDFTTVNEAAPDDIAVILDPGQKPALVRRGIPSDRILVVADEVLRMAAPMIYQNPA